MPVKAQYPYGTCRSCATLGSLEPCLLPGKLRDFSKDNTLLTSGFKFPGTLYDAGGNYWMSSACLIRWSGPVDESQDAYGDSYTPTGLTAAKHVQQIRYIPGGASATDASNIKEALTTYPAVGRLLLQRRRDRQPCRHDRRLGRCLPVRELHHDGAGQPRLARQEQPGSRLGSERLLLGLLLRQLLRHRCARNAVFDGAQRATNYSDVYFYDPLGEVSGFGYSTDTAWGANVVTAPATQSVGALRFFAAVPNTSYTVCAGGYTVTYSVGALPPPDDDITGPVCAAKNITVKHATTPTPNFIAWPPLEMLTVAEGKRRTMPAGCLVETL